MTIEFFDAFFAFVTMATFFCAYDRDDIVAFGVLKGIFYSTLLL
jgi:hypothetical protein